MSDVAHLELKVTSQGADEATRKLTNLEKAGGAVENRMKHVKGAIAGAFTGAVVAGATIATFKAVIQNTIDFQNEQAQLAARLKSTGNAAGHTLDSLNELATAMRSTTAVTGDQISKAQDLLLTFTNVRGVIYDQAIPAILDMSVALRQEAGQSAVLLGKALNDPIKGITALTRSGIQFSHSQKEVIKSLVETGDVAGAQRIILQELSVQFGGSAAAARDTLGGALTNLKETFHELLEGDSGQDGVRGTREAIESLAATMGSAETKASFKVIVDGVFSVTQALVTGISALVEWNKQMNINMGLTADANGQKKGNLLDLFGGTSRMVHGSSDFIGGKLYGDDVRAEHGRNRMAQGRDQWTAGFTGENSKLGTDGTYTDHFPNNAGKAGSEFMPDVLKGPSAFRMTPTMVQPAKGAKPFSQLVGDDDGDAPSKKAAKAAESAAAQRARDLQNLRASLMSEEEAIQASYLAREAIISASGLKGSAEETELRARSKAERDNDLAQVTERQNAQLYAIQDSLLSEEASIQESYRRREEIVLASMASGAPRDALIAKLAAERNIQLAELAITEQSKRDQLMGFALTEQERVAQDRLLHLAELEIFYLDKLGMEEQYQKDKAEIEAVYAKRAAAVVKDEQDKKRQAYGDAFNAVMDMTSRFGQGQGKHAEKMFKISKALHLAQAVMGIADGISNAQTLTYPMNIIEGIRVAAVGATQVATISGQQFAGAYDDGGRIPAGQVGIVGEKGMELVEGPANVTSRKDTARMLKAGRDGDGGNTITNNVTIQVVLDANGNVTGHTTEARSAGAGDAEQAKQLGKLIDLRVRDVLLREQRQGGMLSGGG